jgi:plasmid maintenance system antidote protein VapI
MPSTDTRSQLGPHLHGELRKQNITITAAAAKLGIHRITLANQLKDKSALTLDVAHGIAVMLGTPLSELVKQVENK